MNYFYNIRNITCCEFESSRRSEFILRQMMSIPTAGGSNLWVAPNFIQTRSNMLTTETGLLYYYMLLGFIVFSLLL